MHACAFATQKLLPFSEDDLSHPKPSLVKIQSPRPGSKPSHQIIRFDTRPSERMLSCLAHVHVPTAPLTRQAIALEGKQVEALVRLPGRSLRVAGSV